MKESDKKSYGGCLLAICIFVIFIVWIRFSDSEDEAKAQRYQVLMLQISREKNAEKKITYYNEAYENASTKNDRRMTKSAVIALYEQMGNYSKAHKLLDEFVDEFEESKFTTIHRAFLFIKEGKTDKAIEQFEAVLAEKKSLKSLVC